MRGRRPRSKREKVARGETRPSRIGYGEPDVPAPDKTKAPSDLKGAGLGLWRQHLKPMVETGQLRASDIPFFARHCRTVSDIEFWRKERSKPNLDRIVVLRIQSAIDRLETLAMRQASELGMTVITRSRVKIASKPPAGTEKGDKFFGKGKLRGIDGGRA